MKSDRFFYSAIGAFFLFVMLIGFRAYVLHHTGTNGRMVTPPIVALVAIHGAAIAAWYVLFFVQSLLIATHKRRVHMTLGWASVAIALTIAYTGTMVAVRSVQLAPPAVQFFGIAYSRFLLLMLIEIALFTGLVAVGLVMRKKPRIHRPAMLVASFCLISGATARIPFVTNLFSETGWFSLFGPVFILGAILLLLRSLMTRNFDRPFAAIYAIYVAVFSLAGVLCTTSTWDSVALVILKR